MIKLKKLTGEEELRLMEATHLLKQRLLVPWSKSKIDEFMLAVKDYMELTEKKHKIDLYNRLNQLDIHSHESVFECIGD